MKRKSAQFYFFKEKEIPVVNKWQLLRLKGKSLSANVQLKLEWIISYETVFQNNVAKTTKHYGISRKTFYKWYNKFDRRNLSSLE